MTIPSNLAAQVLARSGRRCCVCRRFSPLRLQVHHIVPVAEGGSDDVENLIALCLTCHTDVHSEVPFIRRFSAHELRLHRDKLYELVQNGVFPELSESQAVYEPPREADFRGLLDQRFPDHPGLMPVAAEILVAAATADGRVLFMDHYLGLALTAGKTPIVKAGASPRIIAEYREGFEQLVARRLVRRLAPRGYEYEVTHSGYLLADELSTARKESARGEGGD